MSARDDRVEKPPYESLSRWPHLAWSTIFHEISRAEGPFKQTTKGDGLSHLWLEERGQTT